VQRKKTKTLSQPEPANATYGCEGWTLKKADRRCIEAFEMWCFRRLLRVSWTQRKTNKWILKTLSEEKQLLYSIKKCKISYYGHITRKTNCIEKDISQGCVSGYRSRRRQRRWTDDIADWTGLQINTAKWRQSGSRRTGTNGIMLCSLATFLEDGTRWWWRCIRLDTMPQRDRESVECNGLES